MRLSFNYGPTYVLSCNAIFWVLINVKKFASKCEKICEQICQNPICWCKPNFTKNALKAMGEVYTKFKNKSHKFLNACCMMKNFAIWKKLW